MRFYAECPECPRRWEVDYELDIINSEKYFCDRKDVYVVVKFTTELTPLEEMNMWLHELYRVGLYDVLGFSQIVDKFLRMALLHIIRKCESLIKEE